MTKYRDMIRCNAYHVKQMFQVRNEFIVIYIVTTDATIFTIGSEQGTLVT